VRILIVAQDFPWPPLGGGLIRTAKLIEAISALGETDLFSLYDPYRAAPPVLSVEAMSSAIPSSLDVRRMEIVECPEVLNPDWWRSWMVHRGTPKELSKRSDDRLPRSRFAAFASDHYDLVWFNTPTVFAWVGRPRLGPTIVDLDNLEDVKARQRSLLLRRKRSDGPRESVRLKGLAALNRINAHDWKVFQRSVAAEVDRVVLCSEDDVRRCGVPNAVVVPNSYDRPARSLGRREVGTPPTILFQGSLHYDPNVDAVDWLIDEVAPRLWEQLPDVQIRLVGTTSPGVEERHRPPAVVLAGRVPEIEPELARADIAVVPLRIGSGTRLKILESFAHRIPVVSTTVGADGLDVEDGVHLLLADRADEFAGACRRLIEDRTLARHLVDEAERRYLECYESSGAKNRVQQLVGDLVASAADGVTSPGERVV
jgi:glycosyltransferase involved in cell wall biosynthesis